MKKCLLLSFIISSVFTLSGCGSNKDASQKENIMPNPVSDPGGYVPGMVNVKNKMEDDINKAVEKENKKIKTELEKSL